MHRRKTKRCNRHHRTIQNQKVRLVVPKISRKALPQLGDAKYGSYENSQGGKEHGSAKDFEQRTLPNPQFLRIHIQNALSAAPAEIRKDDDESEEADCLKEETSYHRVDPRAREGVLVIPRCICDCAADGLEQQGEEVGDHEGYGDCAGRKAGEVVAVEDDYSGYAKVDCGGDEDGGDC